MRYYRFVIAFAIFWMASFCVAAPRSFTLDNTQVIDYHAQANGKDYEIYVRLPDGYDKNPTKKFPLVLLVDGYYAFPLLSAINWRMSERHDEYQQAIVVGISYSKGDDINESRTRDYTPTRAPQEKIKSDPTLAVSGGGPRFVAFLGKEVLPYVLGHYRIDNTKKIFAGHSYGGLLAAYILFTQPDLFDDYLIGSPAFLFDNKVLFRLETEYAKTHTDLPARVFIASGANETEVVRNMFVLEKVLQGRHYPSMTLKMKSLPEEGHLSGYPAFITQGLLWALPPSK